MTLAILNAVEQKRATFPQVNKRAFFGQVPRIVTNLSEIKGRKLNRSIIYRQVSRDDYPQPSWIETFFCGFAATSFASPLRGQSLLAEVATWEQWRAGFEAKPLVSLRDFWDTEATVDSLLAQVRRCHLNGDVYEERALLLKIRQNVDVMLEMTGVSEVPADMRAG